MNNIIITLVGTPHIFIEKLSIPWITEYELEKLNITIDEEAEEPAILAIIIIKGFFQQSSSISSLFFSAFHLPSQFLL